MCQVVGTASAKALGQRELGALESHQERAVWPEGGGQRGAGRMRGPWQEVHSRAQFPRAHGSSLGTTGIWGTRGVT